MSKILRLKKDFVIPKGTEFEFDKNCDSTFYGDANYRLDITLQDTASMNIFVATDVEDDRFEVVEEWNGIFPMVCKSILVFYNSILFFRLANR